MSEKIGTHPGIELRGGIHPPLSLTHPSQEASIAIPLGKEEISFPPFATHYNDFMSWFGFEPQDTRPGRQISKYFHEIYTEIKEIMHTFSKGDKWITDGRSSIMRMLEEQERRNKAHLTAKQKVNGEIKLLSSINSTLNLIITIINRMATDKKRGAIQEKIKKISLPLQRDNGGNTFFNLFVEFVQCKERERIQQEQEQTKNPDLFALKHIITTQLNDKALSSSIIIINDDISINDVPTIDNKTLGECIGKIKHTGEMLSLDVIQEVYQAIINKNIKTIEGENNKNRYKQSMDLFFETYICPLFGEGELKSKQDIISLLGYLQKFVEQVQKKILHDQQKKIDTILDPYTYDSHSKNNNNIGITGMDGDIYEEVKNIYELIQDRINVGNFDPRSSQGIIQKIQEIIIKCDEERRHKERQNTLLSDSIEISTFLVSFLKNIKIDYETLIRREIDKRLYQAYKNKQDYDPSLEEWMIIHSSEDLRMAEQNKRVLEEEIVKLTEELEWYQQQQTKFRPQNIEENTIVTGFLSDRIKSLRDTIEAKKKKLAKLRQGGEKGNQSIVERVRQNIQTKIAYVQELIRQKQQEIHNIREKIATFNTSLQELATLTTIPKDSSQIQEKILGNTIKAFQTNTDVFIQTRKKEIQKEIQNLLDKKRKLIPSISVQEESKKIETTIADLEQLLQSSDKEEIFTWYRNKTIGELQEKIINAKTQQENKLDVWENDLMSLQESLTMYQSTQVPHDPSGDAISVENIIGYVQEVYNKIYNQILCFINDLRAVRDGGKRLVFRKGISGLVICDLHESYERDFFPREQFFAYQNARKKEEIIHKNYPGTNKQKEGKEGEQSYQILFDMRSYTCMMLSIFLSFRTPTGRTGEFCEIGIIQKLHNGTFLPHVSVIQTTPVGIGVSKEGTLVASKVAGGGTSEDFFYQDNKNIFYKTVKQAIFGQADYEVIVQALIDNYNQLSKSSISVGDIEESELINAIMILAYAQFHQGAVIIDDPDNHLRFRFHTKGAEESEDARQKRMARKKQRRTTMRSILGLQEIGETGKFLVPAGYQSPTIIAPIVQKFIDAYNERAKNNK
ncbi:MAG: hypothetical protein NZL83_03200 [Candidatus Absconditabacterales bacterium]|nr:hypothetical protein [Candidatus Absconditabacterales bacterium]